MKAQKREDLLEVLEARFEKNVHRHVGIAWAELQVRLEGSPDAVRSLKAMEGTGGEPDVIDRDKDSGELLRCQRLPRFTSRLNLVQRSAGDV